MQMKIFCINLRNKKYIFFLVKILQIVLALIQLHSKKLLKLNREEIMYNIYETIGS